jgi:dihydroorotate dehydrogenase
MYSSLRRLLFTLPPETAHEFTLDMLGAAERLKLTALLGRTVPRNPVHLMGLTFPNPVGLAAGLDKNADCFNALGALGFGFVEVGTVTPKAQPGNPRPRMFRLEPAQAIINRMGFNNRGVDHLVANVRRRRYDGILGINIGKNAATPVESAVDDYLACLDKVHDVADYVSLNISSPNTPGLRSLQFGDNLKSLLTPVVIRRNQLSEVSGRNVPLLVKIAPDMTDEEVRETAACLKSVGVDGIIATNTTVEREAVTHLTFGDEAGGLSGPPVRDKSTHVIAVLADALDGDLPIVGVGGVDSLEAAKAKIAAGASLIQVYTGFIYRGPRLIRELVAGLNGSPE